MKCSPPSTEARIKEAARKVFLEKGFDGTTTRDIARESGLNMALLNYYFRSKEKLFISVFEDMFQVLFTGMIEIVNRPVPLKEKITAMIEHHFQVFTQHPNLSIFIHTELHRDPEHLQRAMSSAKALAHTQLEEQLREGVARGEIRDVDVKHVLLLIIANIQFVFHSKTMTMHLWQLDERAYANFCEQHKQVVKEMVLHFLFDRHRTKSFFLPGA